MSKRLVAVGDAAYVTLGPAAPVSSLEAATGAEKRIYAGMYEFLLTVMVYQDGVAYGQNIQPNQKCQAALKLRMWVRHSFRSVDRGRPQNNFPIWQSY